MLIIAEHTMYLYVHVLVGSYNAARARLVKIRIYCHCRTRYIYAMLIVHGSVAALRFLAALHEGGQVDVLGS